MIARLISCTVLLSLWTVANAAPAAAPSIKIQRAKNPPRMEDYLGDARAHPEATLIQDFIQRSPTDGAPVTHKTSAYLSYDDKNIYVVFVCQDDPNGVRARMAKREDIGNDDQVTIYLDTFHDKQHAYMFGANPLGVQMDGTVTEGQDNDLNFDTVWDSEGKLTKDGYVVRMAIPFRSVRFPNTESQTWGIALGRWIQRENEVAYWPQITRKNEGFVVQMASLEGIADVRVSHNIQFIPYTTFIPARLLDTTGPARYTTQREFRGGVDGKAIIKNALTLDFTINPDFSQVESDDPQVTVNQRYEVYFPEKRPFFLDNANYFTTPINLFFSRRIADPEFGARLTGKIGNWAIGALVADDRAPGEIAAPGDIGYRDRAEIGVFRAQREFSGGSRFGFLVTERDFAGSYNRIFSFDNRWKINRNWSLTTQAVKSYDKDLEKNKLQGPAYSAELLRSGEHFSYSAGYADRSPNFRAPLGFITRVDVRELKQYAAYTWRPEDSKVVSFGPSFSGNVNWFRTGQLQDWYTYADFNVELKGATSFGVSRYDAEESYVGSKFRHGKTGLSFYSYKWKWLGLYGSYSQGNGINYNPGPDLNPFIGATRDASLGVTFHPTPRLRIGNTYYYERLGTGVQRDLSPTPAAVYTNQILRTKINYQFTRALSLRLIGDYYALLPNVRLYDDVPYKRITGDVLLTYLLKPGTALYAGYNSAYANLTPDLQDPGVLHHLGPPTMLTRRQFFVKLSYLWRL